MYTQIAKKDKEEPDNNSLPNKYRSVELDLFQQYNEKHRDRRIKQINNM